MSKLAAVPSPGQDVASLQRTARALAQNIEHVTGAKGGRIATLEATASSAEVIAKINELIEKLQGM